MSKKYTILYVDDEPLNLKLFKLNLQDKFNVITAISGAEGLDILQKESNINVVISDMKMPGMNGIEFINSAKQFHPDIKYFILTGFGITPEIQEAINTKLIVKYFKKPFNINEIVSTINESLGIGND